MPIVLKSGNLNLLEPSGPVQACNGIALPFYIQLQMNTLQYDARYIQHQINTFQYDARYIQHQTDFVFLKYLFVLLLKPCRFISRNFWEIFKICGTYTVCYWTVWIFSSLGVSYVTVRGFVLCKPLRSKWVTCHYLWRAVFTGLHILPKVQHFVCAHVSLISIFVDDNRSRRNTVPCACWILYNRCICSHAPA